MSHHDPDEEKTRFFSLLSALDQGDEDEPIDQGQSDSREYLKSRKAGDELPRTSSVPAFRDNKQNARVTRRGEQLTMGTPSSIRRRSVSAPDPTPKGKSRSFGSDGSAPSTAVLPLPRSSTFMAADSLDKGIKRKRGKDHNLVPEGQQLFHGLNFFYVPNNDTNTARRMKIHKAVQYGANWVRDWNESVTHLIVDKRITFQQVLDYLKFKSIADHIVVVNELYPPECLIYREMLDPTRRKFQIQGNAKDQAAAAGLASENKSVNEPSKKNVKSIETLPLKPPTAAQLVRVPSTPSASQQSSLESQKDSTAEPPPVSKPEERQYNDALEEVIGRAITAEDLPIDLDEHDAGTSFIGQFADESGSEAELSTKPSKRQKRSDEYKFSCMNKHDGSLNCENPNAHTIEILGKMAEYYEGIKDEWRVRAYRKATSVLKNQAEKISSREQALELPGIGDRLATKIEEIALTHKLRRLDAVQGEDVPLRLFTKIYGVGLSQASKWVAQGFRTLDDIRDRAKLSKSQQVGLDHYHDFLQRIPRREMDQLGAVVRRALEDIDPELQLTIGGSYRRGATDSGDLDCIITRPKANLDLIRNLVIDQAVPSLFELGFLKCGLATTHNKDGSKWNGACALPGEGIPWRRIDLLLVPWDEMGAALIYFTGNDIFNRSIRLLASKKGMRLNQRGLFKDVMRGRQRVKVTDGTLLESKSEKRIFEILGVPWRPPEHRKC